MRTTTTLALPTTDSLDDDVDTVGSSQPNEEEFDSTSSTMSDLQEAEEKLLDTMQGVSTSYALLVASLKHLLKF